MRLHLLGVGGSGLQFEIFRDVLAGAFDIAFGFENSAKDILRAGLLVLRIQLDELLDTFLGGREVAGESAESMAAGAPVLRIEGICVLGGMEVKRKPRKGPRRRRGGLSIEGSLPSIRIRSADRDD